MDRFASPPLPGQMVGLQNLVTRLPKILVHDGFDLVEHPVGFGLQLPGPAAIVRAGVIGPVQALGRRIAQKARNRGVAPCGTVSGPGLARRNRRSGIKTQQTLVVMLRDGLRLHSRPVWSQDPADVVEEITTSFRVSRREGFPERLTIQHFPLT